MIVRWLLLLVSLVPVAVVAQSSADSAEAVSVNPETRSAAEPVPVRFRDTTLFEIAWPIGELTPAARAAAIEQRLLNLANRPATILAELRITEHDGRSEIHAGDLLIRTITDQDAQGTGRTRRQLAADQQALIRDALAVEFRDRSATSVLRGALYTAVASILLVVFLGLLKRLYRWSRARITRAAQSWHWESGLARLSLLSPSTIAGTSRWIAAVIAWLIGLALLYIYLEFVLSLFPWTRGIAKSMVDATRTAVVHVGSGLIGYLPSLLNVIIIVVVARFALRGLKALFHQINAERLTIDGFYSEWALPTYSLVRFLVIAIAAVMVFPYLPGSGSEGFKGVSVFVGLLISLGAASAIANLIAGIVITYMRPFRVGDRVKIADAMGDVIGKDLFVVRLQTTKNVDITIPNALVLANHIVNFSSSAQSKGLILHTSVTIGYDAPWQRVEELLIAAAKNTQGIKAEPLPFVLQTGLEDFYVSYELNAYTDQPNAMAAIYSRLHAQIQDAFNAAGVEIMSPHYSAVRDGSRMAIPDEHLPKDYRAPGFNILTRIFRPESR
jgi:small-conductance mechanosensitive channel